MSFQQPTTTMPFPEKPPTSHSLSSHTTLAPSPIPTPPSRFSLLLNHTRTAFSGISVALSICVLALAARNIAVYKKTSLGGDYFLPVWTEGLKIGSTVGLVVGGSLMTVLSGGVLALAFMKKSFLNNGLSILFSLCTFAIAVTTTIYHFVANSSAETFETWSCEWRHVSMTVEPHFGTLCAQVKASVRLNVVVIPVQVVVIGVIVVAIVVDKWSKLRRELKK